MAWGEKNQSGYFVGRIGPDIKPPGPSRGLPSDLFSSKHT